MRFWQNYFDTGEYLLGRLVNSLELGCDCVGDIAYLDVPIADARGNVKVLPNAICIHEEDAGVLGTTRAVHRDDRCAPAANIRDLFLRHGRQLRLGFYWYLYLDGKIEFEAKATGLVFTAAYDERTAQFASELAPGLQATPYHQHLFCARLDMAVDDGPAAIDEVDVITLPIDEQNTHGSAIGFTRTRLTSEKGARRRADNSIGRTWRVSSTTRKNQLGRPVSYVLARRESPCFSRSRSR